MKIAELIVPVVHSRAYPDTDYDGGSGNVFFGLIAFLVIFYGIGFIFVLTRNLLKDAYIAFTDARNLRTKSTRTQNHYGISFTDSKVVFLSDFNVRTPKVLNCERYASLFFWVCPYTRESSKGKNLHATAMTYHPIVMLGNPEQMTITMTLDTHGTFEVSLRQYTKGIKYIGLPIMIYSDQVTLYGKQLTPHPCAS